MNVVASAAVTMTTQQNVSGISGSCAEPESSVDGHLAGRCSTR